MFKYPLSQLIYCYKMHTTFLHLMQYFLDFFWHLSLLLSGRTYHFAQGDEMTFGFDALSDPVIKDIIYMCHNLSNKQLVVSTFLARAIEKNFERTNYDLIPVSVEPFFQPVSEKVSRQVMIVGSEINQFKNVPMILEACDILRSRGGMK